MGFKIEELLKRCVICQCKFMHITNEPKIQFTFYQPLNYMCTSVICSTYFIALYSCETSELFVCKAMPLAHNIEPSPLAHQCEIFFSTLCIWVIFTNCKRKTFCAFSQQLSVFSVLSDYGAEDACTNYLKNLKEH